jgi:hypothetical protein
LDPNLGYEPGNCRYATPEQQRQNQRRVGAVTAFTDAELSTEIMRRFWHEGQQTLLVRHLLFQGRRR